MFFFCEDRLFAGKTVFSHNVESCFTCQHGHIWNGLFVMFVYVDNNRPRQPTSRKTTVSTNLAFLKKIIGIITELQWLWKTLVVSGSYASIYQHTREERTGSRTNGEI
jgi:hypothetical protein